MPDHLKANLLDLLTLLFPDTIKDIDTAILGINHVYETLHWDWYNRYSTGGEGAPTGIHPDLLTKDSAKKSSGSQFFPRQSQEARDHPEHIQKLWELFKEVFQWQQSVIEKLLPEKCEILRQWVDQLPTNFSSFYPFGGIVLNFNVTTQCHQDWKDQDL
ncbi:hypothetical protein BDZ94DRAFT_1327343 [Collybia nuda]|uniref:Uncharacterized protein n=1 Tax=Collybia nuda TaxID=64659 RepID=A0A9P5XRW6_9AGAR|nr:hypothetical protein BDZ94DRAFT_1327343 [Collybia nuda]